MSEPNQYELAKSKEKLGALVPVLRDVHGNVIDGLHRLKDDPNWPSVTVETITDPIQLILARMATNVCRREVPPEEKTQWLKELAELTKWTPQEMVENTGMKYTWIMKYLPDEFKDQMKAEAGKIGGVESGASRREAKPRRLTEIQRDEWGRPQIFTCDLCANSTVTPVFYDDKPYCATCDLKVEQNPELLNPTKPRPAKEKPVKTFKPPETWAQRKATMTPQHSKMEQALLEKLNEKGYHPIVDHEFCLQSTRPDFYFKDKNLAIYVDGSVHEGKESRDDALRELLAKRHGVRVVAIPYKAFSQQETDRVLTRILEEA